MIRFRRVRFLNTSAVVVALTLAMTATPLQAAAAGPAPSWGQVNSTQTPPGRAFAAMSYDSVRGQTVMFAGGPMTGPNFSDTWVWDGTAWTQKTPAISPPGLVGAAMVFDSNLGRSVLFGGSPDPTIYLNWTWEWDGAAWTILRPGMQPPARMWHAMAYDSVRNRIVLFGGTGPNGILGDTWEFDGITWRDISPSTAPSLRYGAAMAFDPIRNRTVLFGGHDAFGIRLADTWEWDGSNWTQRSPSSAPYPRFWHSMAFDVQEGKTVLFGGDHVRPFGLGPINDTWEWDGSQWTQVWPSGAPEPRSAQAMVYDSGRGRMVVFGGVNAIYTQPAYNDTWELGTGIVTPAGSPTVTFSPANVNFESVNVGSTSIPHDVFPINSGSGPLLISATSTTGDFSIPSTDCPVAPDALAAGSFCHVVVAFSPTAIGNRVGSLVIADNGPSGAQSLALQATGIGNPSTLTVNSATARLGSTVTLSATLTANGAPVLGAAVTFTLPNGVSATIPTDSQGIALWASASAAGIAVGSYPGGIQATFGGNQSILAASASATLTVVPDTDLALAGVPGDITVNATDSSGAVVTYAPPTAVDEAGDSVAATAVCSPASGSIFAIGTTTVTCTATDGDDVPGTVSQPFNVTVLDTDLGLAGVPGNVTVNATDSSGAVVTYTAPTAVDEAGDSSAAAASCTPASGSTFAIGTTTVTCTATDGDDIPGAVSQAFTVTVLDTDLAITSVPGNITVNAGGPTGVVVTYTAPTAVDESGDSSVATASCTPASGSTFAIGTTTVTCTATDGDDTPGTVSQAFTITVLDTDLALTGVPTNITVNASSPSGAMVTYAPPTAVDETGDSPAASVSCTPVSGSTFAIGTTTVTCTATDADDSPGTASQAFTVTVLDTDLAFTGVPAGITVNATTKSGAVVTYSAPRAADEAGDSAAATAVCVPASGSTFALGTTTVNCTATSADDSPSTVSAKFTVTVLVDLRLAVSISPTTATNGTVVTAHVSLTNSASVSRTVTVVATFSSVSPTGQTITRGSSRVTITLAAGKTAIRSFTFKVERDFPRGNYTFTATASDVTGSVSSGGAFKVI